MKRKKLYYIPGLISLIGLPILLFFMNPEDPEEKTCVKLFLPSDEKPKDGNIKFSKYGVYDLVKKKKLTTIYLDEYIGFDDSQELYLSNTKLSFIQREIERLEFTNDTSSVLKVEFDKQATYGQFIWLMNQTMLYHVRRFALVDNEFYLFANPPPVHYQSQDLILPIDTTNIIVGPAYAGPTKWEIFKWKLSYKFEELKIMAERNYLLVTGFLLFIFIPFIIKIIRRKRNIVTVSAAA